MSIATDPTTEQLIAELYTIDGKAEIVDGRIVLMSPTGRKPGRASGAICSSLRAMRKPVRWFCLSGQCCIFGGLAAPKELCPDAAFSTEAARDEVWKAVARCLRSRCVAKVTTVRTAEREMADKRADYFAAGTKVVWDVDLLSDDVVRVYRADAPNSPRSIAAVKQPRRSPLCRVGSLL